MPALVVGIHVFIIAGKTWMVGTKPGHDEESASAVIASASEAIQNRNWIASSLTLLAMTVFRISPFS
jgi:hypothetical protein